MTPEKLESLLLGTLGRVKSTYSTREKKFIERNDAETGKYPTAIDKLKKSFPSFPNSEPNSYKPSLPEFSNVPLSVLQGQNPRRPHGPYAGHFDECGGFVWLDESGMPFARRPPISYNLN